MNNQKNIKKTPEYYAKRDAERLTQNLEIVEKNDSIVIIPFSKPNRLALIYMVKGMDRISANIRRKLGFTIEYDEATGLLNKLNTFVDRLWAEMLALTPSFHNFKKKDWRELNDPIEYKRILAHRQMAFVFLPRSEEAGQAALAVKNIENQNLTLRVTSNSFDELKNITERYVNLCQDFDDFLCEISKKHNIFYKSQYKQTEVESTTEVTTKKTKT